MQPFWHRVLRHVLIVGITLAVIGYLLGRGFLMSQRVYGGGAYNAENERVLWQTPLVMATLGIAMTVGLDFLSCLFRKRAPVNTAAPETPSPAE